MVQTKLVDLGYVKFGAYYPKSDHAPNSSRSIWDVVKFGVLGVPNLTMSQTYLGQFRAWSDLGHPIPPNLTMFQTYLGRFGPRSSLGHLIPKPDHVPNPSRSIWNMVNDINDT